jgi:WD40 repeat protein
MRWSLEKQWAPKGLLPESSDQPEWFDRLLHAAADRRDSREPGQPIVLVIDGLDDAGAESTADGWLPLGLPISLPNGVFVVATTRLGFDRDLITIRNAVEMQQIEARSLTNLKDMEQYIRDVTDPATGDQVLIAAMNASDVDLNWLRLALAEASSGSWVHLRYILDEIRDGRRNPDDMDRLPADLAAYYSEAIIRWRGDPTNLADQHRWESVCLPLLATLGAARAPLAIDELSSFAGVPAQQASSFIEQTARAFLDRRGDSAETATYVLRDRTLKGLLVGSLPAERPDIAELSEVFVAQNRGSDRKIVEALMPQGRTGTRDWHAASPYLRQHLAAHAAACNLLDDLMTDPGFLLVTSPDEVRGHRDRLRTIQGRNALEAYELCLTDWESLVGEERIARLAVNAVRTGASSLADACTTLTGTRWPIRWVAISDPQPRSRTHRGQVRSVALGKAGERDVVVSGATDMTIRIWDAVTGDLVCEPLEGHGNWVQSVAIGKVGSRDVIASGSDDGTVRLWDAVAGAMLGQPLIGHQGQVLSVTIGHAGARQVIASGATDMSVRIWDALTGAPIGQPLMGHEGHVISVAMGRIGEHDVIISGGADGQARIWDAETGNLIGRPLDGGGNWVGTVAMGRAGTQYVAIGSGDGTVQLWNALTISPVGEPLDGHGGQVLSLAIGRAGERDVIVSASSDGKIRAWDASTRRLIGRPLTGNDGQVLSVAIGRVGEQDLIVSGSSNGTLLVRQHRELLPSSQSGSTTDAYR